MADITIRPARSADQVALASLAQLDSQRPLGGDALVAEVCDTLVAAIDPATMRAVADPFRETADIVELLRLRARPANAARRESRSVAFARLRAA